LDKIPVLMKEGAIVPLTDCIEDNQIENPKEIRLEVFAGKPSEFELYEDLGDLSTKAITKIKYDGSDKISYETEGCLDAIPTDRTYKVHIHKEREEDLSEQIYNLLLNANMEYDKKQEIYYAALEESQDKFNKLMQANPDLSYVFFAIRELLDTLEN
nr:DUF5110 domain-containing protein [Pseudobutyrivibrio sp.]